jgi:hypothetical protein
MVQAAFFICRKTRGEICTDGYSMNALSFFRRRERPDLAPLKAWMRDVFGLSPETSLAINEIMCADVACPGLETVILIMEAGHKTRALKIAKPIAEITEDDIDALFTQSRHEANPAREPAR